MLRICGFNGFQQIDNLVESSGNLENGSRIHKFLKCKEEDCRDVDMTWSNILISKGKCAVLSGFLNGKPNQSIILETPDKQEIIQGRCIRNKNCLLLTSQGKYWQYNLENLEWKELNNLYLPIDKNLSEKLVKIAIGEVINAVLSDAGSVWYMGNKLSPSEIKVLDIDCGKEHGILLSDTGNIYTWGGGSRGQLGNGILESTEEPCEVNLLSGMNVVRIAAGGWHNAVITRDGDLYTWGWNKQGQLGHPTLDGINKDGVAVLTEPRVVDWPNSLNVHILQVSCGTSHTVVLLENGEIWGCGWNKWGQLGNLKTTHLMTKFEISSSISIKRIICGAWNTAFIA
ncbi:RCC1 domain-containing protein 1-like [Rhodnius prolixus]|uniref:Putative alpha-tubulin suppressor and related rcc1 domain-containing protein n=2 Tax=Rhodnius TaxID=13248 RepID=R4G3I2_RHOPR